MVAKVRLVGVVAADFRVGQHPLVAAYGPDAKFTRIVQAVEAVDQVGMSSRLPIFTSRWCPCWDAASGNYVSTASIKEQPSQLGK